MQAVSYEWQKNQASNVQKQGYCTIAITTRYGESATKTTTLSSLTAKNDIKQVRHKRTFDPVSIALPTNTITLTLYNYDDQYDDWYRTYVEYTTRIVVRYGYVLDGGNEDIAGGAFYVNKIVRNNNHTITVSAVSKFDTLDEVLQMSNSLLIDETETLYDLSTAANAPTYNYNSWIINTETDVKGQLLEDYSVFELLKKIFGQTDITFNLASVYGNKTVTLSRWFEIAKLNTLGFLLNWLQGKVTIDRDERLSVSSGNSLYCNSVIRNLNIMQNPLYELTSKVNNVRMTTWKFRTSTKVKDGSYVVTFDLVATTEDTERGYFVRCIPFDYEKFLIGSLRCFDYTASNRITKVEKGLFIPDSDGVKHGEEERCLRITWENTASPSSHRTSPNIQCVAMILDGESTQVDFDTNGRGITCDITSAFLEPEDPEAFAQRLGGYFSNRDLYTLDMRADPARDVGDYVFAELEPGVFSKVLILESELTFDGSFSEKTMVRKIHTDFETVSLNGAAAASYFTVSNGTATAYSSSSANVTVPLKKGTQDITALGDNLFKGKTNLVSCSTAPVITSVGASCFENCTKLKNIILPDSVTTLGDAAFSGCTALTDVIISDNITEVPAYAFNGCNALADVHIPAKATKIGDYAFSGCVALTNINIPSDCNYIGEYAFANSGLTEFCYPAAASGYVRPGCFSGCTNLKRVFIPFSAIRIGEEAFLNCSELEEVILDLGASVLAIEDNAFKNCKNLKRLVLPYAPSRVILKNIFGDTAYKEGGFNGVLYIKRGATTLISWAESYGYKYEIIN